MEKAAGLPFDDIMRDAVFDPLGIRASFMPQRMLGHIDSVASGYRVRRASRTPLLAYDAPALAASPLPPLDPERDFTIAPGRMLISMPDLAKLLCHFGSGDSGPTEMRAPQDGRGSVCGKAGRGLGLSFCPRIMGRDTVLGHQGAAYGMNAEMWLDPATGDGVAMATNGGLLISPGGPVLCGWAAVRLGFSILNA